MKDRCHVHSLKKMFAKKRQDFIRRWESECCHTIVMCYAYLEEYLKTGRKTGRLTTQVRIFEGIIKERNKLMEKNE